MWRPGRSGERRPYIWRLSEDLRASTVPFLIQHGAKEDVKDDEGKIPSDFRGATEAKRRQETLARRDEIRRRGGGLVGSIYRYARWRRETEDGRRKTEDL
jgi:hypothetical protein